MIKPDHKQKGLLAIVIPAYKSVYLSESLKSICQQTNKNFVVYVGDDDSSDDIQSICDCYSKDIAIVYRKFDVNFGRASLTRQWDRCVELSVEPWIWLFSDDDVMDPGCVEMFYAAVQGRESERRLYRFNSVTIAKNGELLRINPPHPSEETPAEFAYHRYCFNRSSYASEYIFHRSIYLESGGFVDFPLAWCSDDASWIKFSLGKKIFTIHGPLVRWRDSSVNVSSKIRHNKIAAVTSLVNYIAWTHQNIGQDEYDKIGISRKIILAIQNKWLVKQMANAAPFGFFGMLHAARICSGTLNISRERAFAMLVIANLLAMNNMISKKASEKL